MVSRKTKKQQVSIEQLDMPATETVVLGKDSGKPEKASSKATLQSGAYYKEYVPDPDNIVEFRFNDGKVLKDIFETMKYLLNETNIIFTPKGLKVQTVDEDDEILVHLVINEDYFRYYHCQLDFFRIGLDIEGLQKTIRVCKKNWTMTWTIKKNAPNKVEILMENPTKTSKVNNILPTRYIKPYNINDDLDYGPAPEVSSAEFQFICKEMHQIGATKLRMDITNDSIEFKNIGGMAERTWTLPIQMCPPVDGEVIPTEIEPVSGIFPLNFLKNFSKAASVSNYVKIYLENGLPLVCEYDLNDQGSVLRYLLSPDSPADDANDAEEDCSDAEDEEEAEQS